MQFLSLLKRVAGISTPQQWTTMAKNTEENACLKFSVPSQFILSTKFTYMRCIITCNEICVYEFEIQIS